MGPSNATTRKPMRHGFPSREWLRESKQIERRSASIACAGIAPRRRQEFRTLHAADPSIRVGRTMPPARRDWRPERQS